MDPTVKSTAFALALALFLGAASPSALAQRKDCDELRSQIDAKLQSRGVKDYSLDIVEAGDTGSARVVGTCDEGTHRIVYARGGGKPTPPVEESTAAPVKSKKATSKKKPGKATPKKKKKQTPAPVPPIGNY